MYTWCMHNIFEAARYHAVFSDLQGWNFSWYVLDCFHTRAKCVIWIWIRNAHFELKFERRYFGPCVRQITSRCVIWNAHFKWRSGGVFQLYASCKSRSKITVWMPWPLNCDLGGGAKWPSNHFRLYILHVAYTEAQEIQMHVWLAGYPDILLPLWSAKSQIRSLVCTLRNSNIAITSLVCTLRNSKCAIQW